MQPSAVHWDHMSTCNEEVLPAYGILRHTKAIQTQIRYQALNITSWISLFWRCLECRYLFRSQIRTLGYIHFSRHLFNLFSSAIPTNFLHPAVVHRPLFSSPLVTIYLCFFLSSSTPTRRLTPCLNLDPWRINGTDIILHILFW